jgi:hypothetical protein
MPIFIIINCLMKIEIKKKKDQTYKIEIKKVVDINILLNKVKVEENIKKKRKVIIFSFATLGLFLFGIFIVSIK